MKEGREGGGKIDFLIYSHLSIQEEGGAGGGGYWGVGGLITVSDYFFKATHSIWQEMRCSEVAAAVNVAERAT